MKLLQETNKFQMAWEHSKMFTIEEGSVWKAFFFFKKKKVNMETKKFKTIFILKN